jgi:hypothetical protein
MPGEDVDSVGYLYFQNGSLGPGKPELVIEN